jgi:signal transduction histidine kinase
MSKVKSLNIQVASIIFYIMVFSGLLTGLCFLFLYLIGILSLFMLTPLFYPFITLVISIAIATSISTMASATILRPLNQLVRATKIISTGNFSVRVQEINDASELADLVRNFNHMAEELGSIEMFRNDFINNFSHEFKTPIVSIRGFAKQLQNDDLSPEKRKEYTDIIISESERLTNMSANILLLTKFENQQFITDQNEYELDEQIRNCIILLEKQWSSKNIEMEIDLDPVKIYSNSEMLSQLWINLIDNAIKYCNSNGHIAISCHDVLDYIEFKINDDGDGMDNIALKHIFDKFYQASKSHETPGNGLGLSIVKRIIELCKGEILVKSEVGQGTTFIIKLPKIQA